MMPAGRPEPAIVAMVLIVLVNVPSRAEAVDGHEWEFNFSPYI